MNMAAHYRSLTSELESLRDRVRNFIHDAHWLTDGEWKESVLRTMIADRLPDTVRIGRGFVITPEGPTTQCDLLLYRADCPVLFRQGDLAFITPEAALAIVEVKSRATKPVVRESLAKLAAIGRTLGPHSEHCTLGLFSYQSAAISHQWLLDALATACTRRCEIVELVNLGCETFVKGWERHPEDRGQIYERWHSYTLDRMSAGYFLTNLLSAVSPLGQSSRFFFPETSKELGRTGTKHYPADRDGA